MHLPIFDVWNTSVVERENQSKQADHHDTEEFFLKKKAKIVTEKTQERKYERKNVLKRIYEKL